MAKKGKKWFVLAFLSLVLAVSISVPISNYIGRLVVSEFLLEIENFIIFDKDGGVHSKDVKSSKEVISFFEILWDQEAAKDSYRVKKVFFTPVSEGLLRLKVFSESNDEALNFIKFSVESLKKQFQFTSLKGRSELGSEVLYYAETRILDVTSGSKSVGLSWFMIVPFFFLTIFFGLGVVSLGFENVSKSKSR